MRNLDNYERAIIHILGMRGKLNTNQISDRLKISWATASNRSKLLFKKGYLIKDKEGYWKLRFIGS